MLFMLRAQHNQSRSKRHLEQPTLADVPGHAAQLHSLLTAWPLKSSSVTARSKRQLQLQLNLVSVQLLQHLVTLQAPGDVE